MPIVVIFLKYDCCRHFVFNLILIINCKIPTMPPHQYYSCSRYTLYYCDIYVIASTQFQQTLFKTKISIEKQYV